MTIVVLSINVAPKLAKVTISNRWPADAVDILRRPVP